MTDDSDDDSGIDSEHEAVADNLDTLDEQLEEIGGDIDSVWRLQERVQASVALGKKTLETVNRYESRLDEFEERIDEMQAQLDELQDEQRLIGAMGDIIGSDRDKRAALILQTLHNDAKANQDDRARMTAREAWSVVNRSVDRSQMYDVLRRAETIVDDHDVCQYVERPRGSEPPSHLLVDLSEGRLPGMIAGKRITPASGGECDE